MQPKFLIDDGKHKSLKFLKLKELQCMRLSIALSNFSSNESSSGLNTLNNVKFFK